jgi:hypothetical protein
MVAAVGGVTGSPAVCLFVRLAFCFQPVPGRSPTLPTDNRDEHTNKETGNNDMKMEL